MERELKVDGIVEYILPSHRLVGSRAEVLAQLEEIVQGLVGLQQIISREQLEQEARRSVAPARARLRLVVS